MLDRLERERDTRRAPMEPLPGFFARRRRTLPPAADVAGRRSRRSGARVTRPAVHQVLATLGYGDAIGHEVLGIRHVLRAAGYESDIFVETADPRLEDLTRDYRELVDASHPDNLLLHHFSIGSKASRVAFALPDRMALIYHNITPPEYFIGVHDLLVRAVLSRPPGALGLRAALRAGARRLGVQPAGARGDRLRPHGRAAGRPGLLPPGRPRRSLHRARIRRRVDQPAVRRPHHPEQADRRADPDLPRLQDALQPALAADRRRGIQRIRDVPGDAPRARRDAWARRTSTCPAT